MNRPSSKQRARSAEAEPECPRTTVVFTDIVGSTRIASRLGDAGWAELLERHHALVRSVLERHRGREMDTTGDGFFIVFDNPTDAVACAIEIRSALLTLDVQVRIGAHAGDCYFVGPKCVGLAIHIGARLAELARPGEILVSGAVADNLDGAFALEDRGEAELRGVPGSWHTYTIVAT